MKWSGIASVAVCVAWGGSFGSQARAVVVYHDGTQPIRITAPPTGSARDAWDHQARRGAFLATPISSQHLLTARHIGGGLGTFTFDGVEYRGVERFDDPDSDLSIVRVDGTLPRWAELWRTPDEVGREALLIGRGQRVGSAIDLGAGTVGWRWDDDDGTRPMSWGRNLVDRIETDDDHGDLLAIDFDRPSDGGLGSDEAALTGGDSGGGLFLLDPADGVWKLAGVHFGVDGPFSTTDGGGIFNATLLDARGLYEVDRRPDPDAYTLLAGNEPVGNSSYSTRIASNLAFIDSVIPEPTMLGLLAGAAVLATGRRRR